jgi:hypothetical protein
MSMVSTYGERGEYRAIKGVPIINSMRCEKITPTCQDTEAAQKIRHLTGLGAHTVGSFILQALLQAACPALGLNL